uniref:Uncharacterized protein n=1 Tax=Dulem virus 118 TaxID=3145595 RepID=A0AAU8AVV1_9VIRU
MLPINYCPLMNSLKIINNFHTVMKSIQNSKDEVLTVRQKRVLEKTIYQLKAEINYCSTLLQELDLEE